MRITIKDKKKKILHEMVPKDPYAINFNRLRKYNV